MRQITSQAEELGRIIDAAVNRPNFKGRTGLTVNLRILSVQIAENGYEVAGKVKPGANLAALIASLKPGKGQRPKEFWAWLLWWVRAQVHINKRRQGLPVKLLSRHIMTLRAIVDNNKSLFDKLTEKYKHTPKEIGAMRRMKAAQGKFHTEVRREEVMAGIVRNTR